MVILKAENISKQYRLGLVGTGTISHDLNRWWAGIRGKEDPYLKVGAVNDRSTKADSDYVWALQDINFEVQQGEVLGIIGKNGAGKSTLLKILSRVTIPTTGEIKTKGRIASLLEVGTGFHPELTGKENIYLNGAILGMTKAEIKAKETEIIEFSGCERYVDTPVKRYSSGMRVRLAFAVAAFLEPDILVIDEVLAVGDAEFQKKAIGKMQDISKGDGRTVLFVSHNMAAVKSLCTRAIVLEHGTTVFEGETDEAVDFYLKERKISDKIDYSRLSSSNIEIKSINVFAKSKSVGQPIYMDDDVIVKVDFFKKSNDNIGLNIRIKDDSENFLFTHGSLNDIDNSKDIGELSYLIEIPKHILNQGEFLLDFGCVIGKSFHFIEENILSFVIYPENKELGSYMGKSKGVFKLKLNWEKC
ncbi:ABC transporter ATP-binding protein [Winogradskyella sediminis]|uniref:Lipopolysaccharide transport system ATP-binding protein n=1 Tax=Winogradskyella sediminis TaxID=1382466 RepID=A0A1H1VG75_9FLAO|nr:ABC transporter ATP-binding protein [Winogradskyella sediminis]REG87709.1 lipopolysaccharide transport system ATP-binding protein [Winogradskyella sediminis]SDS83620.1 lipopolysaccharide transport system ATP-binding protein [Winogradskyella sediminis]